MLGSMTNQSGAMGKKQFLKIHQKEGELYVGLMLDRKNGRDYHLFLMPNQIDTRRLSRRCAWQVAMDWAKSLGGDLPSSTEQALLMANAPEEFEKQCFWSSTVAENSPGLAWVRDFTNGARYCYSKLDIYRARAVRREYIEG